MADLVLTDRVGQVAIVTLNRPQRHNSLVPALLYAFLQALAEIAVDTSVRAVVLQANGRSFSTGGDAKAFVEHAETIAAYSREIVGLLNEVILALIDLPVPVVTAVHGIVTGGSLGFVLGSDIVLVAPEATFTPYYSVVGPSPDGGWATLLPLLIGSRRVAEVLYLNQTIDAKTAVAWGMANRIVPADQIRDEVLRLANDIAAKIGGSIRHTRRLLHWDRNEIAARLAAEREHFVAQMTDGEGLTGFRGFLQQMEARRMKGLAVGQQASSNRVFTDADVADYRVLTGDEGLGYGKIAPETAVPGPLLAGMFSCLLGTELPGRGTNWLKQQLRFPAVARTGDKITAVVEITRLRPEKQLVDLRTICTNPNGEIVCVGAALVLVSDLETNVGIGEIEELERR